MTGLDPVIHAPQRHPSKAWMPGSSLVKPGHDGSEAFGATLLSIHHARASLPTEIPERLHLVVTLHQYLATVGTPDSLEPFLFEAG